MPTPIVEEIWDTQSQSPDKKPVIEEIWDVSPGKSAPVVEEVWDTKPDDMTEVTREVIPEMPRNWIGNPVGELAREITDRAMEDDAVRSGISKSSTNLLLGGKPEKYVPKSTMEGIKQGVGELVGDIPAGVAGAIIGGPMGAVGLPTGIKKVLTDSAEKGPVTLDNYKDRVEDALAETFKGEVLGGMMGVSGKYLPKLLAPVAEVGIIGTASPLLFEGRAPTEQDYIMAGTMVGGMKIAGLLAGGLMRIAAKTGKKPQTIAEEIVADNPPAALDAAKKYPEVAQKLVREYESKIETTEQIKGAQGELNRIGKKLTVDDLVDTPAQRNPKYDTISEKMVTARDDMASEIRRGISDGDFTYEQFMGDPSKYMDSKVMGAHINNPVIRKAVISKVKSHYDPSPTEISAKLKSAEGKWLDDTSRKPFETLENIDSLFSKKKDVLEPATGSGKIGDMGDRFTTGYIEKGLEKQGIPIQKEKPVFRIPERKMSRDAIQAEIIFEREEKASNLYNRFLPDKWKREVRYWLFDSSGNAKIDLKKAGPLGEEATRRYALSKGASAEANRQLMEADINIWKGATSLEQRWLDRYIVAKRAIEITKNNPEYVHPSGLKAYQYEAWINEGIPQQVLKRISPRAEAYWNEMHTQLKQLKNNGIIDDKVYNDILSKGDFYSPQKFLSWLDPETTVKLGERTMSVNSSGLPRLKTGSMALLETDSKKLLQEVITRTQSRIMRNKANLVLERMANEQPDNGMVRYHTMGESEAPAGWVLVKAMKDGKPIELELKESIAKEWTQQDPDLLIDICKILSAFSGTDVTKMLATGINPEFAVNNMPRDVGNAWFRSGNIYSSFLPRYAAQISKDFVSTFRDAWNKKGKYYDSFSKEGGNQAYLSGEGKGAIDKMAYAGIAAKNVIKSAITRQPYESVAGRTNYKKVNSGLAALREVEEGLTKIGETSETWTRLAVFKHAIDKGKTAEEAAFIARNLVDYSLSGPATKIINAISPYFGARLQIGRGLYQSFREDKALFLYKAAQLTAVRMLCKGIAYATNQKAWDMIPERDKSTHFILPFFIPYLNDKNEWQTNYFAVPMNAPEQAMSALADGALALGKGEPVRLSPLMQVVGDMFPLGDIGSIIAPIVKTMVAYGNYDTYRQKQIWKGGNVDPRMERTPYTSPFYNWIGDNIGLSPVRTEAAVNAFFPRSMITGVVGSTMDLAGGKYDKISEKDLGYVIREAFAKNPMSRKLMHTSPPASMQYNESAEKIKQQYNTEKKEQDWNLQEKVQNWLKDKTPENNRLIMDYIKQVPDRQDQKRLNHKQKWMKAIGDTPDKSWWYEVMSAGGGARADIYHQRWKNASQEEKVEMGRNLRKLKLDHDHEFRKQFNRLKRQENYNR